MTGQSSSSFQADRVDTMGEAVEGLTFTKRQFFLNKKPFRILSGAMHYFRVPEEYWSDRMAKMKACGLNTLETSVQLFSILPACVCPCPCQGTPSKKGGEKMAQNLLSTRVQ